MVFVKVLGKRVETDGIRDLENIIDAITLPDLPDGTRDRCICDGSGLRSGCSHPFICSLMQSEMGVRDSVLPTIVWSPSLILPMCERELHVSTNEGIRHEHERLHVYDGEMSERPSRRERQSSSAFADLLGTFPQLNRR